MAANIFSLFGGQRSAVDQALRQSDAARSRQVANNIAAGAARGNVNPVALSRTQNAAGIAERSAMAEQRARMAAQARINEQQDISQLIGGGLSTIGSIGGMLLGGPIGGAAGGALGGAASKAIQQAVGAASGPQTAPQPAQATPGLPSWMTASAQPSRAALAAGYSQTPPAPTGPTPTEASDFQSIIQAPLGLLSDEDSKEAIRDASRAIDEFLRNVNPESFQYRQPQAQGAAPGRQTGVMAQDLQRTPVGRQMVTQMPGGQLGIDPRGAVGPLLAAQARLADRLDALEGRTVREHRLDLTNPQRPVMTRDVNSARPQVTTQPAPNVTITRTPLFSPEEEARLRMQRRQQLPTTASPQMQAVLRQPPAQRRMVLPSR